MCWNSTRAEEVVRPAISQAIAQARQQDHRDLKLQHRSWDSLQKRKPTAHIVNCPSSPLIFIAVTPLMRFAVYSRQAIESSNRGSKASTSKPKTPASHAPSKQYTSAYSASAKSSKVTAPFKPHTFLEAKGKGKGKETATKCEGPTRRKVVPILHESSSEDEMRLDFPKAGSSVSRLERSKKESRGSKDDERKDNVDVCPYAAPEEGVHVHDFLFT